MFTGAMVLIRFWALRPRDLLFVPALPRVSVAASHRREPEIREQARVLQEFVGPVNPADADRQALVAQPTLPALHFPPLRARARYPSPRDRSHQDSARLHVWF